jgi:hypothetical protein
LRRTEVVRFLLKENDWEIRYWNGSECTVEKQTDGRYAIVDHSIQTRIAEADTEEEAYDWLR